MKTLFFSILLMVSTPILSAQSSQSESKEKIHNLLNAWHEAAAAAHFEDYFAKMAEESVFIGTDPTENWNKAEFMARSRPYFEKGKAWSFEVMERNIFLAKDCRLAWFDELLETHMGICRGSGVLAEEDGRWKIKHYVLSIEIPNENVSEVTELKKDFDQKIISGYQAKK